MALGVEVGLGPGHIVLDGDTAPLPKKGGEQSQTAGCIKMPPPGNGGRPQGNRTLRTQYTSVPRHFGTSAQVSRRHFGTGAEVS